MNYALFLLLFFLSWLSLAISWAGDSRRPSSPTIVSSGPTIRLCLTDLEDVTVVLEQDTTFSIDTECKSASVQRFKLSILARLPHALAWDRMTFAESYGLRLPLKTSTVGTPHVLVLGFECKGKAPLCEVIATTESR